MGPLPLAPLLLTWLPFLYLLCYIFRNQETLAISREAEISIRFIDSKNSGGKNGSVKRVSPNIRLFSNYPKLLRLLSYLNCEDRFFADWQNPNFHLYSTCVMLSISPRSLFVNITFTSNTHLPSAH